MSSLDTEARTLIAAATVVADALVVRAHSIRAAAKIIDGIMRRAASGCEPSESRDGPKWDAAVKVLEAAGVAVPNSAYMSWRT